MPYRVRSGGSVLGPDGILYRAGQVIPNGVLSPALVREHLNSGYIAEANTDPRLFREGDVEVAPGVDTNPAAVKSGESAGGGVEIAPTLKMTGPLNTVSSPKNPNPNKAKSNKSIWTLDPSTLKEKTLEELNVMVAERDPGIDAFETAEEAIAHLSADFGK